MTPSPILKVLSTIRRNGVRSLLMGGQACILYGGTEFSCDTDILAVTGADFGFFKSHSAGDRLSRPHTGSHNLLHGPDARRR